MSKILIVDDEEDIADLISDVLVDENFQTTIKYNGTTALSAIESEQFDLILLDVMLPDISGIEICKNIREKVDCPIVFLTAKNQLNDKLEGLNIGADDYITKPFVIDELVARVKAHIRREKRNNEYTYNIIKIGEIEINKDTHEVKKNEELITLSTKEFELLSYLMSNAGIVLSKEQIYNNVWKTEYGDIGTVAVNIKSLRNKLDKEEKYILTIWGLGYKFVKVIS